MLGPIAALTFAHRFVGLVRDPENLDIVFRMADARDAEPRIRAMLEAHEDIVAVAHGPSMRELPPMSVLRRAPVGSLGRAYAAFMDRDGLVPDVLDRSHPDTEEGRVRRHFELSHDLWHVVTGFGPELAGELGLQAFYLAQAPTFLSLPAIAAGLLHVLIYCPETYAGVMDAIAEGWRSGRAARSLVGLDWHTWLDRDLACLRAELGVRAYRAPVEGAGLAVGDAIGSTG